MLNLFKGNLTFMLNFTCMMKQQLQHMLSAWKSDSVKWRHQARKWVILQSRNVLHYHFIYFCPGNFGNTVVALSLERADGNPFIALISKAFTRRTKHQTLFRKTNLDYHMEEGAGMATAAHQWHIDAKEGTLQPVFAEGRDLSCTQLQQQLKGTAHNVI